MADKPQILVIDDGLTYAEVVARRMPEFQLVVAGEPAHAPRLADGHAALDFLAKGRDQVDVVVLDMHFDVPDEVLLPLSPEASPRRTRRFQGVAILREIRRRFPSLPVVLLTSQSDLSLVDAGGEVASQSMTYFLDSEDLDSLRIRINAALQEVAAAVEENDVHWGGAPAMRALRRRLAVMARGRMPIILEGETGTGKSFIAEQFVHANSGRGGPFVTADLSAIPSDLVAAHLFGALKGAYTGSVADRKGLFEMAHGGTLFLDEVQNIPVEAQKQLLLVLQDRCVRPLGSSKVVDVDVKVIAASNSPLARSVARGTFRRDLYMRLSPATRVVIPPLRERLEDLPHLADHFVGKAAGEPENAGLASQLARALGLRGREELELVLGHPSVARPDDRLHLLVPSPVWKLLRDHPWPGNVRELEMVMHNLVTFTLVGAVEALRSGMTLTSSRLQVDPGLVTTLLAGYEDLPGEDHGRTVDPATLGLRVDVGDTLNAVSNAVERQYFEIFFRRCRGDFAHMARLLLGDPERARAVRLRFNQLGLKVKDLR